MRYFEIMKKILLFCFLWLALPILAAQAANTNPNHDSSLAQAGDCTRCHSGTASSVAVMPKQAACRECHVKWNPATETLQVVGLMQAYNAPPAEVLKHEIFSNSGAEIQIYDYEVCFGCHNGT